jgi:hypothetical protein
MYPKIDDRDREIISGRAAHFDEQPGPRVGDWLIFADDEARRITVIYDETYAQPGVQTSRNGRFYLGDGYVSAGGSYDSVTPMDTIQPVHGEARPGLIWIFHHDHRAAHNGVEEMIPFRVYRTSRNTPDC